MIWDLNCQKKSSEESKVDYYEENSEDLNEEKIELNRESDLVKCKYHIDIFFILIEKDEYLLILFNPYSLASNVLTLDSKQNHEIIEYVDRKIKSMTNKRYEIEVREKERPIHEKNIQSIIWKKNWWRGIKFTFSFAIAN